VIAFSLLIMAALLTTTFLLVWRRTIHPIGFPVLAAGSFAYFHLFQPAYLSQSGVAQFYMSDWQITKTVLISALMFGVFLWGWFAGSGRFREQVQAESWNFAKLYRRGFLLSCIGAGLFLISIQESGSVLLYYSTPHGMRSIFQNQTAYLYLGHLLPFPGLVMMLIAVFRGRNTPIRWGGITLVAGAVLLNAILTTSRGALFEIIVVLGLTGYLVLRKVPDTRTILIGGALTGIALLALVGYRQVLHLGPQTNIGPANFMEAVMRIPTITESSMRARVAHPEFIITAGIIEAVDETQKYNLGIDWIYLVTVQIIPRRLWPEKPNLWNIGVSYNDFPRIIGWMPSNGAATSLVGDTYRQFGMLSIFLWFILGRASRAIFDRAWKTGSPVWQIAYVLLFAFGLGLFAQGFGRLLRSIIYTAIPSLILAAGCRRQSRKITLARGSQASGIG